MPELYIGEQHFFEFIVESLDIENFIDYIMDREYLIKTKLIEQMCDSYFIQEPYGSYENKLPLYKKFKTNYQSIHKNIIKNILNNYNHEDIVKMLKDILQVELYEKLNIIDEKNSQKNKQKILNSLTKDEIKELVNKHL